MSKKFKVVKDDLNIKGSGMYCFLPYEQLDEHHKGVFKVGMTIGPFEKRTEQYHTYFPLGVYMVAFLENPTVPKTHTKTSYYLKIEKFIFDSIQSNGGIRIYSTTRIKNPNEKKEGETEWVYCDVHAINSAFLAAQKMFGGKAHTFSLRKLNLNKKLREKEKDEPNYVGKIVFNFM